MQLQLAFEDSSDLGFVAGAEPTKALVVPGRRQVKLVVEAREGFFIPDDFPLERRVSIDGILLDRDADGQLDEIALAYVIVDNSRLYG